MRFGCVKMIMDISITSSFQDMCSIGHTISSDKLHRISA